MVDFIELIDSDSSCDDQNQSECNSGSSIENGDRPTENTFSPNDTCCEEQFESDTFQEGKAAHFWKSFNTTKRCFNDDDGSERISTTLSTDQRKASSRIQSSVICAHILRRPKKSTLQKFDDDNDHDDSCGGSDRADDDGSSDKHSTSIKQCDDDAGDASFLSGASFSDGEDFLSDQKLATASHSSSDVSPIQDEKTNEQVDDDIASSGYDIMRKFGDKNFGADTSISFSYASSKLFNNIAKSNQDIDGSTSRLKGNRMATTESNNRNNPYSKRKALDSEKPIEKPDRATQQDTNKTELEDDSSHEKIANTSSKQDDLKIEVKSLWERILEVDPDFCKPPNRNGKSDPIVHYLTKQTRPDRMRRLIPVNSVFGEPLASFWRSKFHSFNELQSELVAVTANSDESLVVSAPTAAGKTCIFEMAVCRLLAQLIESMGNVTVYTATIEIPNNKKTLYIAPNKALCEERFDDWTRRFQSIYPKIEIALVTGDSDSQSFTQIASAHVILTTPEKWDSITRRWTEHFFLIGSVKLLLIDEVHMLGDEQRGGCLESLICRMKTVQRATQSQGLSRVNFDEMRVSSISIPALASKMRICAVSATLPNIADIAAFLDVKEAFYFDETYRPVELKTHVVGLGYKGKNHYLFDKNLDRHVPELLDRFSDGKPSIVFCHSKKDTERLATEIASTFTAPSQSLLDDACKKTNSGVLQKCLKKGIAFHHAGMDADNRRLVEHTFTKGLIKCLCATSTLAIGVNLPAHLVIIKGTSAYRGALVGHVDIDIGTILQMIGRAGRPGFDSSGTAVIMTDMKSKSRYEKLSTGLEAVESKLLSQLTEILNTEVSQRVLTNIKQATDWLKGTFFFNCIRRNPSHYGFFKKTEQERESYLMKRCLESLQELNNASIIKIQEVTMNLNPENASHVMNHHMVPFDAMKLIIGLAFDSGPLQLLQVVSKMSGLHFPVRKAEKVHLNEAHKEIKYKLEGPISKIRVQTSEEKAFVLLQAAIGQIYLDDYTLRQEMSSTVEYAKRMLCAIEEYSVVSSKHGAVALESLLLRRSLNTSLWSANDGALNQIKGVGQKSVRKLADHSVKTFADVLSHTSDEIEQACGRSSPFGQELRAAVRQIFQTSLNLSAYVNEIDLDHPLLICTLKRLQNADMSSDADNGGVVSYTLTVHVDGPGSLLMFREDICDEGVHSIECPKTFGRLYIRLVCNLVGMDEQLSIDGSGKIAKSLFSVSPKAKRAKTANQDSARNRLHLMDKFVDGIDDIRVHKRKITAQNSSISQKESNSIKGASTPAVPSLASTHTQKDGEVVTPSPRVPMISVSTRQLHSIVPFSKSPAPVHTHSSWLQNKSAQTTLQRRVFKSAKDNPFTSFSCDPNNLENQMQMQAEERSEYKDNTANFGGRFSRISRSNPLANALKRKLVSQSSVRVPNHDLLRMKAEEQQAYAEAQGAFKRNNCKPNWPPESTRPNAYGYNNYTCPSNPTGYDSSLSEFQLYDRPHALSFGNNSASYGSLEIASTTIPPMNIPIHHGTGFDDFSTFHGVTNSPFFDQVPSVNIHTSSYKYMRPSFYDRNVLDRAFHHQNEANLNYHSPHLNNHVTDYHVAVSDPIADWDLYRNDDSDFMPTSHVFKTNSDYSMFQPGFRNMSMNPVSDLDMRNVPAVSISERDDFNLSSGANFYSHNTASLYPTCTAIANPLRTVCDNQRNSNQMFDEAFF